MRKGLLGDLHAAEHARNLLNPALFLQCLYRGVGAFCTALLADLKVVVALGCNLWQVSYAEHLPSFAQLAQQFAYDLGSASAYAAIDLIKDEGRDLPALQGGHLNSEADARQLATGSDPGEWLRGLPRVGADQKLNLIKAVAAGALFWQRLDYDPENTLWHV